MKHSLALFLVVTFSMTGFNERVVSGQATGDSQIPAKRAHHSLAYDESRGELILFGGSTADENDENYHF